MNPRQLALAAWRLAVQDKAPELLPILRQFKVERTAEGVSLSGSVPSNALLKLQQEKKQAAR